MSSPTKPTKVKTVQFAVGIDLLGSKMTLSAARGNDLEATPLGVMAYSRSTNRYVLIPYSNCKGIEFYPPTAGAEKKESSK